MKFDTTINLGHILQVVAFICAALTAYYSIDKRVARLEFLVAQNESLTARMDAAEDRLLILEQTP